MTGAVILLLLGALVVEFCTGGMVRSISPVPGDLAFRRIAHATWWAAPTLVTAASGAGAWTLRDQAPVAAALIAVTATTGAILCWRWRPQRAEELRVPRLLFRLRRSVEIPIRDSAAWRRQLTCVAVAMFLVLVVLLRRA